MRFTFWGSPQEKDAVASLLADYSESSGVLALPEHSPGDYATKLNALVAGNIEPDCGYLGEALLILHRVLAEHGKTNFVISKIALNGYGRLIGGR